MAVFLPVNGPLARIEPAGPDGKLTLQQMQELVEGYIEFVRVASLFGKDVTQVQFFLVVNKEGLLRRMPLNQNASRIAGQAIVGPAILGELGTDFD